MRRFGTAINSIKKVQRVSKTSVILITAGSGALAFYTFSSPISLDAKVSYGGLSDLTGTKSIKVDYDKKVTVDDFLKEVDQGRLLVVIDSKVYDLTEFAARHPGGSPILLKNKGKDITNLFGTMHNGDVIKKLLPPNKFLGILIGELPAVEEELTEEEIVLADRYRNRPDINNIFNISDFEYVCSKILPKDLFSYYATGSDDEFSLRNNHYAFQRVFFRPQVLTDTSKVDLSTTVIGQKVGLPFYATAFAGQGKANTHGELNVTKAAKKHGFAQMIPLLSSKPLNEIVNAADEDQVQWAQIHFASAEDLANAPKVIEKMNNTKNVKAIFINADLASESNREKDFRTRMLSSDKDKDLETFASKTHVYPTLTWEHMLKFKELSKKPLLIKGMNRTEDIVKAAELGFLGCVISNHGGRQMDYAKPPLETLSETMPVLRQQQFYKREKFDVFIDGGIRRGSDIIKALCLGASGVGMGRPFAYLIASYGAEGVDKLAALLKDEIERDMKLLGAKNVQELNESLIDTKGLYYRAPGDDRMYNAIYQPLPFPKFKDE